MIVSFLKVLCSSYTDQLCAIYWIGKSSLSSPKYWFRYSASSCVWGTLLWFDKDALLNSPLFGCGCLSGNKSFDHDGPAYSILWFPRLVMRDLVRGPLGKHLVSLPFPQSTRLVAQVEIWEDIRFRQVSSHSFLWVRRVAWEGFEDEQSGSMPTRAPRGSLHKYQGWCSCVQNPPTPAGEGPRCASFPSSMFIAMSVVPCLLWRGYFHPSKHYESSPHLPVLLSLGVGPPGNPVLGLQPHLEGLGPVLTLPEGREWQLALLPSLPSQSNCF